MDIYSTPEYGAYGQEYGYEDYTGQPQYTTSDPYSPPTYPNYAAEPYVASDYEDYTDGGIFIEDEYYEELPGPDEEAWLPYTPPPTTSPSSNGAQQQVVLAGFPGMFPSQDIAGSWCNLYPAECAAKKDPIAVNSTCIGGNGTRGANGTCAEMVAADKGMGSALGKVDLSGLGMVLMIAMLLLVGVHFGWDSEKEPGSKGDKEKGSPGELILTS